MTKDMNEYDYRKQKWSTHMTGTENENMYDMLEFLWIKGILDRKTKYALVKYCLKWCFNTLRNEFPNYKEIINEVYNNEQK